MLSDLLKHVLFFENALKYLTVGIIASLFSLCLQLTFLYITHDLPKSLCAGYGASEEGVIICVRRASGRS